MSPREWREGFQIMVVKQQSKRISPLHVCHALSIPPNLRAEQAILQNKICNTTHGDV